MQLQLEGLAGDNEANPVRLARLKVLAENCTACPLHKERINVVFGAGDCQNPDIMFVSEAPSGKDDLAGKPFSGSSRVRLKELLVKADLVGRTMYACSAVCCRPRDNKYPSDKELRACSGFLYDQIRCVRPKIIVAFGSCAATRLLGKAVEIEDCRGKWFEWEGIPAIATYHPAHLMKDLADFIKDQMKKDSDADFNKIKDRLNGYRE